MNPWAFPILFLVYFVFSMVISRASSGRSSIFLLVASMFRNIETIQNTIFSCFPMWRKTFRKQYYIELRKINERLIEKTHTVENGEGHIS